MLDAADNLHKKIFLKELGKVNDKMNVLHNLSFTALKLKWKDMMLNRQLSGVKVKDALMFFSTRPVL